MAGLDMTAEKCSWQDIHFIGYENGAGRTNKILSVCSEGGTD